MNRIISFVLAAILTAAVAAGAATVANAASTTDTLTRETTGVKDGVTSYAAWTDKTASSSAVYAGNSAGDKNAIQLRSKNNNSGIVTTSSGGFALSVELAWNSGTADGRTINVYGKDSAYTDASDLYDSAKQGTLLGTLVKGTSTTLSLGKGSKFIGLRSDNGALYLDSVKIVWSDTEGTESGEDPEPEENYTTPDEIVNAAYALEHKAKLKNEYTLSGIITFIRFAWSSSKGASFDMSIDGVTTDENKNRTIYVYQLKDNRLDGAHVGDAVTVKGTLTRYNNDVEFTNATLVSFTSNYVPPASYPTTPEEIINDAYGLAAGETLEAPPENNGKYTLTGVISQIDNKGNKFIVVGDLTDKPIQCYNLKAADDASDEIKNALTDLRVGDTITVTGPIKNYNGTIEFNGCTLDAVTLIEREPEVLPETPEEILDALYELDAGGSLKGTCELKGKIKSIDTKYSSEYKNITVTIVVDGHPDKPVQCYRLAGNGADKLAVGDTITVSGTLKNFDGTREFAQGCQIVSYSPATGDGLIAMAVVAAVALAGVCLTAKRKAA